MTRIQYLKVIRFLIAGGASAAVDLSALYFFTSIVGWWYLLSAVLAFIIAFWVSFGLQKFWTFADHTTDRIHFQLGIYFIITSVNLGLNTLMMYLLVDGFRLHYLIAQIIASGLLACESFFIYQRFVFLTD